MHGRAIFCSRIVSGVCEEAPISALGAETPVWQVIKSFTSVKVESFLRRTLIKSRPAWGYVDFLRSGSLLQVEATTLRDWIPMKAIMVQGLICGCHKLVSQLYCTILVIFLYMYEYIYTYDKLETPQFLIPVYFG